MKFKYEREEKAVPDVNEEEKEEKSGFVEPIPCRYSVQRFAKGPGVGLAAKCKKLVMAQKVIREIVGVDQSLLNPAFDSCFCIECHRARKDRPYYYRGDPPLRYGLPIGWVKLGLSVSKGKCKINQIFSKWHGMYVNYCILSDVR